MSRLDFCRKLFCFIEKCITKVEYKSFIYCCEFFKGDRFFRITRSKTSTELGRSITKLSAKYPGIETMFADAQAINEMFNMMAADQRNLAADFLRYCCLRERFNQEVRVIMSYCYWLTIREHAERYFQQIAR